MTVKDKSNSTVAYIYLLPFSARHVASGQQQEAGRLEAGRCTVFKTDMEQRAEEKEHRSTTHYNVQVGFIQ